MTGTGGSKMETIIYILTTIFILIIGVTLLLSFSVVALFAGGALMALSVIAIFVAKVIAAIRDILHGGDKGVQV